MLDLVALKRRYKHFKINSTPNNTCTSGFGCFSVVWRGFVISIAGDSVGFVVVGVVRHRRRRKLFARRRCRLQEAGNRKATTGSTQSTTFIRLHECIQHFLMLYFFHASLFTVTS